MSAYSLRALAAPAVSMPVTWNELETALDANDVERLRFTPEDALAGVEKRGDAFESVMTLKQKLPTVESKAPFSPP